MLAHLIDVSIRALVLAALPVIWLLLLRGRRPAAMEHAIWTAVLCGMLALFAFESAWPKLPLPVLKSEAVPAPVIPAVSVPVPWSAYDAATLAAPVQPAKPRSVDWAEVAAALYSAVALILLVRLLIGILLAARLIRSSVPIRNFRESDRIAVPVTIGLVRPQILLPMSWREWDRAKLRAVLAHEGAHVRRRDNLVAALGAINRSVFWLHPLAWWLEHRLAVLAEFACDEACVAEIGDRAQYASLLLDMARVVDGSLGRLERHALTMAAGSHIRQRVETVLADTRKASRGLRWTAWAAIAACGVPLLWGTGAIQLERQVPALPLLAFERFPFVRPAPPPPPPPRPMLAQVRRSGTTAAKAKFEVASIRPAAPSKAANPPPPSGVPAGALPPPPPPPPGSSTNCVGRFTVDAGRVEVGCITLRGILSVQAFKVPPHKLIGPDWMDNSFFDFSAKLPQGATEDQLPEMFQSLLEDRFGLAFHRENREQPVYALVVAKGGPKLKPADLELPGWAADASKNAPSWSAHGIIFGVPFRLLASSPGPDGVPMTIRETPDMGIVRFSTSGGPAGSRRSEAPNITSQGLAELAQMMGAGTEVIDQTGLKGRYQADLQISMADIMAQVAGPERVDPAAFQQAQLRAVQEAFKKLGLQLEPRKAPVEVIVIDHLERTPSAN